MKKKSGFTFIELLVVMSIIATLLTLALPNYFKSVVRSKESVLKQNLFTVREAIDFYYADNGVYPSNLEVLVTEKYLRALPVDPIINSTEQWVIVSPKNADEIGMYDIQSSSTKVSSNGLLYSEW